jgi:hypothetical protein
MQTILTFVIAVSKLSWPLLLLSGGESSVITCTPSDAKVTDPSTSDVTGNFACVKGQILVNASELLYDTFLSCLRTLYFSSELT